MGVGFWWDISDPCAKWFQRSGAVLVAVAAASEFYQMPIDKIGLTGEVGHYRVQKFFRRFGFMAIIVGTIVWAYGDMPFQQTC